MPGDKQCQLHIAMYPWFAFGHLISFLHLANKLAERGHRVSFFLPSKTLPKLATRNRYPHLITFIPLTVPRVDGLPDGAETTHDVPVSARPLIMTAMDLTRDTIDSHLTRLMPECVLFDFTHWLPELARMHGVKSMYYSTVDMSAFSYVLMESQNFSSEHKLTEADLLEPPPGFPCPSIRLQPYEARNLADTCMEDFGGLTFLSRHRIGLKECDAIGVKTCREIEGPYCDFVEKHLGKPVLLTGPSIPEPPNSSLDEEFDRWLKGFGIGTVVYCALGSECALDKDRFQELVLGLELTGRPFLAALKPPKEHKTIDSALPKGFKERTKERGLVHSGWVQQQLILQHPSIGCFVTHCGAGSLSEALVSECQIVLLPQAVDQFINARLMSQELRLGIEVERRGEDGFFTKEAISKAVSLVMEEESEVEKMVRANHAKWRDFLRSPGLEESYIASFVRDLQNLIKNTDQK